MTGNKECHQYQITRKTNDILYSYLLISPEMGTGKTIFYGKLYNHFNLKYSFGSAKESSATGSSFPLLLHSWEGLQ